MNLEFCCSSFDWYVKDAGLKGIAIFPVCFEGTYHFILQARSCDPDSQITVYRINSVIHFCPSCGYNLDKFIEENIQAIVSLAEEKKHLLVDCDP